jgi:hypothetical protein
MQATLSVFSFAGVPRFQVYESYGIDNYMGFRKTDRRGHLQQTGEMGQQVGRDGFLRPAQGAPSRRKHTGSSGPVEYVCRGVAVCV